MWASQTTCDVPLVAKLVLMANELVLTVAPSTPAARQTAAVVSARRLPLSAAASPEAAVAMHMRTWERQEKGDDILLSPSGSIVLAAGPLSLEHSEPSSTMPGMVLSSSSHSSASGQSARVREKMFPPSEVLPNSPISNRPGSTSSNSSAVRSSVGSESAALDLSSPIEPRCAPSTEKTLPFSSMPAGATLACARSLSRRLAEGGGLWLPAGGPPRPRPRPRPRKLLIPPPRPRGWPRFRAVAFELRTATASVILRNLRSDGHRLLPAESFLVWPKPRQFQQSGSFATLAPAEPASEDRE